MLEFARVPHTAADIKRAVVAGQFGRMRELEESFGVDNAKGDRHERFIRQGQVGGWQLELDSEAARQLEHKYGPVMEKIGYTASRSQVTR